MVDTSAFETQGSAGGGPAMFYIKDKNGNIAEVEIAKEQFQAPMTGYYTLKLKALSAPFEMTGAYGLAKKVRAVFVTKAPGTPNDKRMFSQLLTIAVPDNNGGWRPNISKNSASGQMIGAIRGNPIAAGEPINLLHYLNGEFAAMVNQTTKATEDGMQVYASVVKDTWQPAPQQQVAPPQAAAPPPPLAPIADDSDALFDDVPY